MEAGALLVLKRNQLHVVYIQRSGIRCSGTTAPPILHIFLTHNTVEVKNGIFFCMLFSEQNHIVIFYEAFYIGFQLGIYFIKKVP
jgi:hypothetical protein